MLSCACNVNPIIPHLYIVKLGLTGAYIIFLLAHLSQRLMGELKVYTCSGAHRCLSPFSNIFSSEAAGPIRALFYVEPPWEGGNKVCINCPGHMNKMAAIYGKNL